jgi:hypothetical protein
MELRDKPGGENEARRLAEWLAGLKLGPPAIVDALAVAPLYAEAAPISFNYLGLDEALATGQVTVTEKAQASVPTLLVINHSTLPILLLDGEEVVGGRQNRVVNASLLVPAESVFELDVTCVEHGRWHEQGRNFSSGEAVYPTLRRQKAEHVAASLAAAGGPRTDQSAVWDEIAAVHRSRGTRSETAAVHDVYIDLSESLERAEDVLSCPADGPVGLVAFIGGRAVCADIFDRPTTLRAYWRRLVRSYALEAEGATPATASLKSAGRLMASASAAVPVAHPSSGLGWDFRLTAATVVGAALVYQEEVVHTALFSKRTPGRGVGVRRPVERARRLESQ